LTRKCRVCLCKSHDVMLDFLWLKHHVTKHTIWTKVINALLIP